MVTYQYVVQATTDETHAMESGAVIHSEAPRDQYGCCPEHKEGKEQSAMTSPIKTATYYVEAFQEGEWWVARVAGLGANHTQARTFDEVGDMARDLIALASDTEETQVGEMVITENDWR